MENAVEHYALTLKITEETTHPSEEQVIEVLLARDVVQNVINEDVGRSGKIVTQLAHLDTRLQEHGEQIAVTVDLPHMCETLNRSTEGWRWVFHPPLNPKDRFDWVWDVLTMIALALSAGYIAILFEL